MTKLEAIANHWPYPVAALLCGAMIATMAIEKVDLPDWLVSAFEGSPPEQPAPKPAPEPKSVSIPYAPSPGRDDRTPIAFLSQVFDLGDSTLPSKLSGIGPVFWDHAGHGSGALIAPNLVLTTGHLFAERGKWEGPLGPTEKPPAPSDGRFYLQSCGRAYDFKAIHMGSLAPRNILGLDYAIAELATPACTEATVLPVALTPDDLHGAEGQILLNMGAYRFSDLPRFAQHPLFDAQANNSNRFARYAVFGVRCQATAHKDTGDVAEGSTGLVITSGCDGIPGGSGGPLIVSRDGGANYSIVGVANSYRKTDAEYNNYTAIEGAFAAHLSEFVDVSGLPAAASSLPSSSHPDTTDHGPWDAMASVPSSEDVQ
jgi:hypothetical protein